MPSVHYYNRVFPCGDGQTVLDVLLENGQDIPHSCKMGVCVTCVMQVQDGEIPALAQDGLRPSLAAQGHFLPCVCQPASDIRVTNADDQDLFSPAMVQDIEYLPRDVCRVFIEPTTPLYYRAGQFLNIRREDGLSRSYSLASVPSQDTRLEFHIKRLERGQMSNWVLDELKPGQHLSIQGPIGNCYYQPGRPEQSMLLIGNGTGLAPLIGIAKDALSSGHKGSICLYHGSQSQTGLYLSDELNALQEEHGNFHYKPCISRETAPNGYHQGRADDIAFNEHSDLKDHRIFLCGYAPMVYSAETRARRAGASLAEIYTDPYELKDLREKPRD
jgi:NAD(P)H-flavin reductase/ferredoxin